MKGWSKPVSSAAVAREIIFCFPSRLELMPRSLQSRSTPSINADTATGTASDQVDVVPEISTKPLKKRRRLTRDRFDALYLEPREKSTLDLLQASRPDLDRRANRIRQSSPTRMAERVRLNRHSTDLAAGPASLLHLGFSVGVGFVSDNSHQGQRPVIGLEASFITDPIEIPPYSGSQT